MSTPLDEAGTCGQEPVTPEQESLPLRVEECDFDGLLEPLAPEQLALLNELLGAC